MSQAGDPYAIQIVTAEPRLAAVARSMVSFAEMGSAQRAARVALAEAASAGLIAPVGRPLTLWHPPRDGVVDYAPGVFVAAPFESEGGVLCDTVPGGRVARLRWRGPYETLGDGWRRLAEGCAERGLPRAGINWEIYASDGSTREIETELHMLLARVD